MIKLARHRQRKGVITDIMIILLSCWVVGQVSLAVPLLVHSYDVQTREHALRFWDVAKNILAPVYGPLAEQIVCEFKIAEKEGIGIDVGSGPGILIIELCKRTRRMHWINADINPHFFPLFFKAAEDAKVENRISAVFADAQALPFRDNYADIIVSRGSFHLWKDKLQAFSEIYRVIKPGGIAFIGQGFSENLPVDIAKKVRAKQGGGPRYDIAKTAAEMREIMKVLGIKEYRIRFPKPPGSEGVNYGIWLEFHKSVFFMCSQVDLFLDRGSFEFVFSSSNHASLPL